MANPSQPGSPKIPANPVPGTTPTTGPASYPWWKYYTTPMSFTFVGGESADAAKPSTAVSHEGCQLEMTQLKADMFYFVKYITQRGLKHSKECPYEMCNCGVDVAQSLAIDAYNRLKEQFASIDATASK